jgi:F-type H+-transporting ATPase subunit b
LAAIFEALRLDPWTFFFQIANLLIVISILYYLLWKPVSKLLEEREQKIAGQLADAASAKEQSERLLQEYEAKMLQVKQEAHDIIAKATRLGDDIKEEIIAKAREEAERTITVAKAEIQSEKIRAMASLREEAAVLAVLAAGKLLHKTITVEDHRRLVQEFIQEVGDVQ